MDFYVVGRDDRFPSTARNCAYLKYDRWNDYDFVTMFYVIIYDQSGVEHDLGNVKIGFRGQTKDTSTMSKLQRHFPELSDEFFSLGNNVEYYNKLANSVPEPLAKEYVAGMRDLAANPELLESVIDEEVLSISLLRDVSLPSIKQQFVRVLSGGSVRTNYDFIYEKSGGEDTAGIELKFSVEADSAPSSNVHALIGRNGIGKTTILNGIVKAALGQGNNQDRLYHTGQLSPPL